MEVVETMKVKNKEIVKPGAFPVAAAAGAGMSPTVSFKNDPNLEVLAKTWTSARTDLLPLIVTTATWNQDESDLHSKGLPWSPCEFKKRIYRQWGPDNPILKSSALMKTQKDF